MYFCLSNEDDMVSLNNESLLKIKLTLHLSYGTRNQGYNAEGVH